MKKWMKVLLGVLLCLVVIAGGLVIWQWNNVKALQYMSTMDKGQLQVKIDQNDQNLKDVMKEYQIGAYEFTAEDLEAIENGLMTVEDAVSKLLEKPSAESSDGEAPKPTPAPGETPSATPVPQGKPDSSVEVQKLVAKMYVLKAQFVSKLEGIVSGAMEEFSALSPEEQTTAAKQKIVAGKIGALSQLESQCDGEIAAIVSELHTLLQKSGQDTALADKVRQVYEQEKSLKKAYYINEVR